MIDEQEQDEKIRVLIVLEETTGDVKLEGVPLTTFSSYASLTNGKILVKDGGTSEHVATIKFMNVTNDADGHGPLFDEILGKGNWYLVFDFEGKELTHPLRIKDWQRRSMQKSKDYSYFTV